MTGKLPRDVDGPTLLRALIRAGFELDRQSGSHAVVIFPQDRSRDVVVPLHSGRALATGTMVPIALTSHHTAKHKLDRGSMTQMGQSGSMVSAPDADF